MVDPLSCDETEDAVVDHIDMICVCCYGVHYQTKHYCVFRFDNSERITTSNIGRYSRIMYKLMVKEHLEVVTLVEPDAEKLVVQSRGLFALGGRMNILDAASDEAVAIGL